jgi:hypothetical protein
MAVINPSRIVSSVTRVTWRAVTGANNRARIYLAPFLVCRTCRLFEVFFPKPLLRLGLLGALEPMLLIVNYIHFKILVGVCDIDELSCALNLEG